MSWTHRPFGWTMLVGVAPSFLVPSCAASSVFRFASSVFPLDQHSSICLRGCDRFDRLRSWCWIEAVEAIAHAQVDVRSRRWAEFFGMEELVVIPTLVAFPTSDFPPIFRTWAKTSSMPSTVGGREDDGKRSDTSIADIDESSADLRFLEQKSSVRLVLFDRSIDKNRDGRPPYSRRFKSVRSTTGPRILWYPIDSTPTGPSILDACGTVSPSCPGEIGWSVSIVR